MPRFNADDLRSAGLRIFIAAGVEKEPAAAVMHSLVLSNLMGVDSHGIVRVAEYVRALKSGAIVPDSQPRITRENDVVTILDGERGFGQIVARHSMSLTIGKSTAERSRS